MSSARWFLCLLWCLELVGCSGSDNGTEASAEEAGASDASVVSSDVVRTPDPSGADAASSGTMEPPSSVDAGASVAVDCGLLPTDQRLRCACIELALRGEAPPAAVAGLCAQMLGQDCCAENEVCLTAPGGGVPSAGPSTLSTLCIPRPPSCAQLSCGCFANDPCMQAQRGQCGRAVGPLPQVSRTLRCLGA